MSEKIMLKIENIKKDYQLGNSSDVVHALKGVNINFRKNEFVSILGPSGCGKTTLLNIIGGLDKYTDGDLIISGRSTKKYSDRDWDIYRNHRIGFIFQSYNLIPHQTILENVELALTISGIKKKERVEKAKKALDKVGLKGMYNKHPNQLSGGQCQRVAIARALVNEPEILLADEPTGALDTVTSTQIMDLIQEISKEKLVIMVTHNPDIAKQYSTRIIKLLDGLIIDDSNPLIDKEKENKKVFNDLNEKAKMSFRTSFRLSARNLISKAKRTILVCIAGSIGIVGVSTVLAVSSGIHGYIDSMQDDMLSGNPITISETSYDLKGLMESMTAMERVEAVIEDGKINVNSLIEYLISQDEAMNSFTMNNTITQEYIDFIEEMPKDNYSAIKYDYGYDLSNNIYTDWHYDNGKANIAPQNVSLSAVTKIYGSVLEKTSRANYSSYIAQIDDVLSLSLNNSDYILNQYDLLEGKVATEKDEIMIVVNKDRQLTDITLAQLGYYTQEEFINFLWKADDVTDKYEEENYKTSFDYDELLAKEFRWYPNNSIFNKNTNPITSSYNPFTYNAYEDEITNLDGSINLKVVGILQPKDDIMYGCLQAGFYYTEALSNYIKEYNLNSEIINYYKEQFAEKDQDSIISMPYEVSEGVSIDRGVTFKYTYYFEGEEFVNNTGYLGTESAYGNFLSMIFPSMGENSSKSYSITLRQLGGEEIPSVISIYPINFESKYKVTNYLDQWNEEKPLTINETTITNRDEINYTDNLEIIINMINTMINIITYALIVFTALSLLVSTVMIGIITYVSVVERVKEIGVIRSLGGRKKDVSNLFYAETFIIGLISGIFGILITLFISLIINLVVGHFTGIYTIASLRVYQAIIMILVSVLLTSISGLIPARAAARKNPVDALRSE